MRLLLTTLCVLGTATLAACSDDPAPTAPTGAMAPSAPARTVATFGFTQIGTPGVLTFNAKMNDAGQVALTTRPGFTNIAVVWVNGSMQSLAGGPNSIGTTTTGINALGTIAGLDRTAGATLPAIWENGVYVPLALYPGGTGAQASAINDAGRIVGFDGDGLFWSDKSVAAPLRLQSLGKGSLPYDINDGGVIVGASEEVGIDDTPRAVVWTSETAAPQVLAGFASGARCEGFLAQASAINELGEIVGQCPISGGVLHAAYWANKDAEPVDLDLLAGASAATGINELGQVIGTAGTVVHHAMLWSREGGAFRRLDLGVPAGLVESNGMALNNTGQAVLTGPDQAFVDQSFLVSIPMGAAIDLDPSSAANTIKLGGKGTVTVAILGSRWFRAADVDPSSLTLGNDDGLDTPVSVKKGAPVAKLTDVNRDGFVDLVADFAAGALVNDGDLVAGTQTLVLLGQTRTGAHVRGTDVARAVK